MSHLHRHQDLRIVPDAILLFLQTFCPWETSMILLVLRSRATLENESLHSWRLCDPTKVLYKNLVLKKKSAMFIDFFWSWVLKLHPKETTILRVLPLAMESSDRVAGHIVVSSDRGKIRCFPPSFHSWNLRKSDDTLPETNIAGP